MTRHQGGETGRLQSIQVLRAAAVIAVVLFHFGALKDGRAGVDLFFCISGFVMAGLMDRPVRQFAIDRFVRIYPPFLAAMTLTFILVPQPLEPVKLSLSLLLYPDKDVIYLYPAWSLGFEAIFYIACALSMKFGGRWLLAAYALLFAFDVPYLGSAFVLEFLAGYAIARRAWWALPILLLAAVSEPRVLAYGSIGAALLWLGVRFEQRLRGPVWRPLAAIGDASYSIYLTHVAVGSLLVGLLPAMSAIPACLLFGLLFHQLVERPLLKMCREWVAGWTVRPAVSAA
jgi:exopolysaccharide production protein ExoZ